MAEEILDGINPTRMELLALKDREKLLKSSSIS